MKVAILIGVGLEWVTADLYINWKSISQANYDRIIVITDRERELRPSHMVDEVVGLSSQTIHPDVLEFIGEMNRTKKLHRYVDKSDLIETVTATLVGCMQAYIYYSGHAKDNSFLLPNREDISFQEFHKLIMSNIPPASEGGQCFTLIDSCEGNGLMLNLKMDPSGRHVLTKSAREKCLLGTCVWTKPEVICFSSTQQDERALIVPGGSNFTRAFFDATFMDLCLRRDRIQAMCERNYAQTVTVHVSHHTIKRIWPWVFGCTNVSARVVDGSVTMWGVGGA